MYYKDIPIDELEKIFYYKDGKLFRKRGPRAFKRAGGLYRGYRYVRVYNKMYSEHRIIFTLCHKRTIKPGYEIDHLNRIRDDNRIENLMEKTRSENQLNKPKRYNCSSQYKGVSWDTNSQKFKAYMSLMGKIEHIGLFDDEKEAAKSYDKRVMEVYGEMAILNFPDDKVDKQT